MSLGDVDPGAVPENPTWEMVFPILDRACAPCHTGDEAPGRASHGTPEARPAAALRAAEEDDLDYGSCAGILRGLEDLVDTGLEEESMPPGAWPRLDEREKLLIRRWIDQGACAPCGNPCP
jgi:hypothetical protein